ncbi:hypothetical protein RvY_03497-2 [Ramazzottius varieornatus]|uniref:Amino acid permease/ SLC12A domain-containing protein n=1 Tax=Ramazzottius varieornatus TaxID=947166 RepID=A0A1D1URN1_RAMVA|nr:hypothetical protein RvY_03497-2 [Ramazzottius varieornatus]
MVLILLMTSVLYLSQRLRFRLSRQVFPPRSLPLDTFMGVLSGDFQDHLIRIKGNLPSGALVTTMSIICGLVIVSYFNAILPYRLAVEALTKAPFSTVKDFLQSDFTIYSYFSVKESFLVCVNFAGQAKC